MQLRKAFGLVLISERKLRNITQAQLAEHADVHPTVISAVERGTRPPNFDTLELISTSLSVPLSYLFKLAEDMVDRNPEL
jgi:transcriptional regulator with XRE-family HTH domain